MWTGEVLASVGDTVTPFLIKGDNVVIQTWKRGKTRVAIYQGKKKVEVIHFKEAWVVHITRRKKRDK